MKQFHYMNGNEGSSCSLWKMLTLTQNYVYEGTYRSFGLGANKRFPILAYTMRINIMMNKVIVTFESPFSIVRTEKNLGYGVAEEEEEELYWR